MEIIKDLLKHIFHNLMENISQQMDALEMKMDFIELQEELMMLSLYQVTI